MKIENEKEDANRAARQPPDFSTKMTDASMVTTNQEIPGYAIQNSFGVVRGISVRSRSVIGNFGAGLQAIVGGQISLMEKLCEDTRRVAFDRMRADAAKMGANGIYGMRFDANEISDGITEVLCYGTAVKVAPVRGKETTSEAP